MIRFVGFLAVFALILFALNFFFHLHIAIGSSLVLTIILSVVFSFFQSRPG